MRRRASLTLLLLLAAAALATTAGPGARGEQYADPLTGRVVRRMTTDGRDLGAINHQGDMSSEASAFSPDSRSVVFAKCCGRGAAPRGVYVMDVASGKARLLARTDLWNPYPVFARDGREVYYYDQRGHGAQVMAVSVQTGRTRRVAWFPEADWQEKIEVNADGSLLSVHLRAGGVFHTHLLRPDGTPLPGWDASVPSGDGGLWNPVHPERLVVRRGGVVRAWNVRDVSDTSWAWTCQGCDVSHAAWHPNGEHYFTAGYVVNSRTGASLGGTGLWPIHPHIRPTDGMRGLDARITADEAPWFFSGQGRPRLYAPTLREAMRGDFRRNLVAVHYSSYATNASHPHPHWSHDGRFIFFVSDVQSNRDGWPPGQDGPAKGGVDIFLVDMAAEPARTDGGANAQRLR
jgi:hypothetical protein